MMVSFHLRLARRDRVHLRAVSWAVLLLAACVFLLPVPAPAQSSGTAAKEKPQGLTPEDEYRIQKELNWNPAMNPCSKCESAWEEMITNKDSPARYLECVKEYCPAQETQTLTKPDQNPQASTCPGSGGHCTSPPCTPGPDCESPQASTCPGSGGHCTSPICTPGPDCEGPQAGTCPGSGGHCTSPTCTPGPDCDPARASALEGIRQLIQRKLDQEPKPGAMKPETPRLSGEEKLAQGQEQAIVGIVTPTHRDKDKPFSGTITTNPQQFEGIPGLQVQEVKLPLAQGSDGKPTLEGLIVSLEESSNRVQPSIRTGFIQIKNGPAVPDGTPVHVFEFVMQQPQLQIPNGDKPLPDSIDQTAKSSVISSQPLDHPPVLPSQPLSDPPVSLAMKQALYHQGMVVGKLTDGQPVLSFLPLGNPPVLYTVPLTPGTQPRLLPISTFNSNTTGVPPVTVPNQPTPEHDPRSAANPALITTDPVCLPGSVTAIHGAGQFSGDSSKLRLFLNGAPVGPVAVSTDEIFFRVPDSAPDVVQDGSLFVADEGPNGWFGASTTIHVLHLQTAIANPNLHRGLHTTATVGLTAVDQSLRRPPSIYGDSAVELGESVTPESYDPALVNFAELQKRVPDFHPPEKGQPGVIVLSLQNHTPGIISLDGGDIRTWYLRADSLPFHTQLGIKAINDGGFDIRVIAQPLFPLVQMQRYQLPPDLVDKLEALQAQR